jgi:Conserved TM helix
MESVQNALRTFLEYIPQLIGAIIILIVGYIVARILQAVVSRVLHAIGFDRWMERGGIKQFFDRAQTTETPATVLGRLVFWFVFIIAITMAADALGIRQVSEVLGQLIAYIPSIIAAILILVLAALLANFLAGIVRGATGSDLLSNIALRDHNLCGVCCYNGARDSGAAYGAYVSDHFGCCGIGSSHSVWLWRAGGCQGHRREGLRAQGRSQADGTARRLRRR